MVNRKTSQDHRKITRAIWLVLTILLILCYSLQNVAGTAYYSMLTASQMSVSSPPIILQAGTSGGNTIYANSTSAKVSTVAPAPAPTYYPNSYNVITGTYLSGSVPTSVQTIDSNYFIVGSAATATAATGYNPSGYNLLGSLVNYPMVKTL